MKLPFTIDQFMEIFATYNLAIWPGQIIAYLLGAAALFFAIKRVNLGIWEDFGLAVSGLFSIAVFPGQHGHAAGKEGLQWRRI